MTSPPQTSNSKSQSTGWSWPHLINKSATDSSGRPSCYRSPSAQSNSSITAAMVSRSRPVSATSGQRDIDLKPQDEPAPIPKTEEPIDNIVPTSESKAKPNGISDPDFLPQSSSEYPPTPPPGPLPTPTKIESAGPPHCVEPPLYRPIRVDSQMEPIEPETLPRNFEIMSAPNSSSLPPPKILIVRATEDSCEEPLSVPGTPEMRFSVDETATLKNEIPHAPEISIPSPALIPEGLNDIQVKVPGKVKKRKAIIRKGRLVILRGPVLDILLGRELASITKPALKNAAMLGSVKPVDVPPVEVTPL